MSVRRSFSTGLHFFTISESAGDSRQQRETFQCQALGLAFLSQEYDDQRSEEPPGKFQCSQCPYSSDLSLDVARHERTHTSEAPALRPLYPKSLTSESNLKIRQQEETPHECETCGQRFTKAGNLRRHRRLVHAPDSPWFTCSHCGKGFTRKDGLETHLLTHTGERRHTCHTCGMRFARLGDMNRHQSIVHDRQYPHYCPHCGKGLSSVGNLRQHLRTQHQKESEGAVEGNE